MISDWTYRLPDIVWDIPESERAEKAFFNSDLCQFGKRYFIRCVLEVPFTETLGHFGWGVWAEVDLPVFHRYLELYDKDGSSEVPHSGMLANALLAYQNALGAAVTIQFRDPLKRPALYLAQNDQSHLANEQREGINNARYHEILDIIAHN